ncbi:MAG TPA: hypothetical protein VFC46_09030 [Humisphaera sp.]|nr:hypothetical protein [Humisphaera sp.]
MNDTPRDPRVVDGRHMSSDSSTPPIPLGYESPQNRASRKRPAGTVAMTFAFIGGFIVGAGGTLFLSGIVVAFAETSRAFVGFRAMCLIAEVLYCLSLFVAISLTIRLMMRPDWRTIDRSEALGLLLGAALSLLAIGGICLSEL